ncbi:DUF2254 domain-containing protein [Sediminicoccus sp. BL-A-41-H5]|uniref:DUF2254 domain-containing protein n=1 Tax=Sediminicoccus sp. BL-A-41-H5 TaxID=3421106 RepID=UPI003D66EF2E
MSHHLRERLEALGDAFWLRPALLVLACVLLGETSVWVEREGGGGLVIPDAWLYAGGEAGARSLLGAVAASTIGVAGTTFSITIAALSLASAQMGPRLLRNFVRDAGNQMALGVFLGTFAYSLVVLRTVRSLEEGAFVPHLGVTGALILALLCVGTLVWFVHHVATGINVETVIAVVHDDLMAAMSRLTLAEPADAAAAPPAGGRPVTLEATGYLRSLDEEGLADWAAGAGVTLTLLARPGDYLFPGVPIARVMSAGPQGDVEAAERLRAALTTGPRQAAAQDVEFAVRQLVEIAIRGLSPGVNDPFTAVAVLNHLGAALCTCRDRHFPGPALHRDGRIVLFRRVTDYDGLTDAMFHLIRLNAAGSAAVLIRLLEVLAAVLEVERDAGRRAALLRHAGLAHALGRDTLRDAAALDDLDARRDATLAVPCPAA